MSFVEELKRRRVPRVLLAYLVVGFATIEGADILVPHLGLPDWTVTWVVALTLVGLPLAIGLAWAFDVSPGGIERTRPAIAAVPPSDGEPEKGAAPSAAGPRRGARSVAALPFANMSGDPENEYFSDGITEEILSRLAKVRALKVISRTSVMRYKDTDLPLGKIADELGVANILEGSVRRAGNRVRITAQLIEADTDVHLWAESYDRELEDVFAVQSDVATNIARALEAEISTSERERIERRPTADLTAYQLYLRGRQYVEGFRAAELGQAISMFEQAIEVDPSFAEAYAGLSDALMLLPYFASERPSRIFERARLAADRALELQPDLAEALIADATVRLHYEWDWDGVDRILRRANQTTGGSPWSWFWESVYSMLRQRYDRALHLIEEALKLNPFSPFALTHQVEFLVMAGRAPEALPLALNVIEQFPDFYWAHYMLALTRRTLGQADEAVDGFRRAAELAPDHELPLGSLAVALVGAGRPEEAASILDDLEERAGREWVDPFPLALASFALGHLERGLDYLEQGERERSFLTLWIRTVLPLPAYAAVREHPRLKAFLHRVWPEDFPAPAGLTVED